MKKFGMLLLLFGIISISSTYAASIGDVALRFCNNPEKLEKTISLTTSGNQEQNICMVLINGGNEDVSITMNFVDGTITNDADQKKACKNEGENENFGKYVSIPTNKITVPARGSTTLTGTITLPEEAAGEIRGCVTYFIEGEKNQKDMFKVMVRRANFIDIFAKGVVSIGLEFVDVTSQIKSISKNSKILSFFEKDEKKLYIQSILQNKGTAEQGITIKGEIKNRLGYKKTFLEEKRTIFSKQASNINNVIDDLPFYKGPFTITYSVIHSANIGNGLETNDAIKDGEIMEQANIIIIGRETYVSIVVLLIIIAIITIIITKSKITKKIHKHISSKKNQKKSKKSKSK